MDIKSPVTASATPPKPAPATDAKNDKTKTEKSDKTDKPKKQRKWVKPAVMVLVCLVIFGAGFGAAYYWQQQDIDELKTANSEQAADIAELQAQIDSGTAAVDQAKANASAAADAAANAPSLAENIEAAISSGNTAALEGYMADSVRVIIAASEGVGDRTPAQAVQDLAYLNAGTDPWDFSLPTDTLNEWRNGDYAQYVPFPAVIGKSANGYVVSFQFNHAGDIAMIFMSASDDLM